MVYSNLSNLKIYSSLTSIGISSNTATLNTAINSFFDCDGQYAIFIHNQSSLENGITDLPAGYGLLTIYKWGGRVQVCYQVNTRIWFATGNTTDGRNITPDNLSLVPYVRNNLTASSYTNGEVLSAYQGYLLNQNKASSSTFNDLKDCFANAICEGGEYGNIRLQTLLINEPSSQSGDDRLVYLRTQFMKSDVISVNRVGIIRYSDKNETWYIGIGLKTTDPASRCQIFVTNYFGEAHLLSYAPRGDNNTLTWVDYKLNQNDEPGFQIGAGQTYSFTYDNFCRVTLFRGSNWFDFTCDNWSALQSRSKTAGFDVTASCSNKTITIVNNTSSAVNGLVVVPNYVQTT